MLNTAATIVDPDALRQRLVGALVTPADPTWDEARAGWALAADQRPAGVVIPSTVQDVVETVRFAAEHGLRVAPQGTGHNATARGPLTGAILVRFDLLRGVTVDPRRRVARLEAGAWCKDVVDAAVEHGLAPISGSSPNVGMVGFTLGGGIGWLSRKLGMSANSVHAVECVLADGTQVRATEDEHAELFWALRGGTGSFAVVTAMEVRLHDVGEQLAMGQFFWRWERAGEVVEAWRQWCETAPEEVTTSIRLLQIPPLPEIPEPLRGGQFVVVDGAVIGDEDFANAVLQPLRDLRPEMDMWAMQSPANLCYVHMDPEDPMPGISDHLMLDDLDAQAVADLVRVAGPGSGTALVMTEIRHLGGALARRPEGAGALGCLDAKYLTFAGGLPLDDDVAQAIVGSLGRVRTVLERVSSDRHYPNFQEAARSTEHAYRPEAHARLRAVKAAYDPDNRVSANHEVVA